MHFAPLRRRNFALLWWAGLMSIAGDWTLRIALPFYVLRLTGSPLATSGVVAAGLAGVLVVGAAAGVYVDRWDRRRTMVIVSVLQAVSLLPLLAVHSAGSIWIVYVVTFAEAALGQFFAPAENALLPKLVGDDQLPAANALNTLNNNIGRLTGPALGGLLAAWLGLHGVALADAASFLLAAGMIALITGDHQPPATEKAGFRAEFVDGLRSIARSPLTIALLAIITVLSVGEGVMGSVFAIFVTGPLRGGSAQIGWLMSAQAAGGVLGGIAGTPIAARLRPGLLLSAGLIAFGLVDLAIFNYPRLSAEIWPGLVLFAVVGIPAVVTSAAFMTLLQREVGDAYMGRVYAVMLVGQSLAGLAGAGLAGWLTDRVGVLTMLTVQGACPVLCGVGFALFLARVRPLAARDRTAVVSAELAPVGDPS
ncbi:MFS transporter [Hamadaea tsunoensis]|uniref:MFS transporter n=1 Tax=Hamadaea tsunoensis TaxID=53368 RepID=UPI00040D605C|nr:MFS transporter [Hamadaea tsunoensis]